MEPKMANQIVNRMLDELADIGHKSDTLADSFKMCPHKISEGAISSRAWGIWRLLNSATDELEISGVRRLWNLQQPKYHDIPKWMCTLVRLAYQPIGFSGRKLRAKADIADWMLNRSLLASPSRVMDHWGTIQTNRSEAFICEPYGPTIEQIQAAKQFADDIGATLHHGPMSWHYPGRTYRFEFRIGTTKNDKP